MEWLRVMLEVPFLHKKWFPIGFKDPSVAGLLSHFRNDEIFQNIVTAYKSAESGVTRTRILSIVAGCVPYRVTMELFQCSMYAVYQAKQLTAKHGVGALIPKVKHTRNRLGFQKVFLDMSFEHEDVVYYSPTTSLLLFVASSLISF